MLDADGKVTFTPEEQAVVDKAIQDRLAREQSKYADHDDIKGIVEELQAFGYQGTPREIREAVKAQREAVQKQAELEALKDEAGKNGTSPELLAEIRALKAEIQEIKNAPAKADEEKRKAQQAADAQVAKFSEKFPDIDVEKLFANDKFKKFVGRSNPSLSLIDVYEDFQEFVGGAEAEAIAKIKSNLDRSTASGREKGETGGTYGLTSRQQDLAKDGGMSFKEYAEFMKLVKR